MSAGRLRDRVAVETLDDERLARIERGVITSLPARAPARAPLRGFAPWLAAAAIAAAALIGWRMAPRRAALAPSPTVVVAGAGGARVELGDAVVVAGAGAAFTVARPDGAVDIVLARGRIELDVASRHGRPPLTVHADDVDVVVVGTRFSVERDDEVTVTVTEGLVRVERDGAADMVAAGQAWARPARTAIAAADVEDVAAGDGDGATIDEAAAPSSDTVAGDPVVVDVLHERLAAVPGATVVTDGDDTRPVRPTGKRAPDRDDRKAPPPLPDPLGELMAELAAQPLAAAATGASGALYGEALAEYRDGKLRKANRLLDAYTIRFPSGAEREAVAWLRLRIACTRDVDGACRKAANGYLARHDDGAPRAGIARRITATR